MQSIVRAFGSEHPWIQDPLNASQWLFLHLSGHSSSQLGEYLMESQPTNVNSLIIIFFENEGENENQVLISTHIDSLLALSVFYA